MQKSAIFYNLSQQRPVNEFELFIVERHEKICSHFDVKMLFVGTDQFRKFMILMQMAESGHGIAEGLLHQTILNGNLKKADHELTQNNLLDPARNRAISRAGNHE